MFSNPSDCINNTTFRKIWKNFSPHCRGGNNRFESSSTIPMLLFNLIEIPAWAEVHEIKQPRRDLDIKVAVRVLSESWARDVGGSGGTAGCDLIRLSVVVQHVPVTCSAGDTSADGGMTSSVQLLNSLLMSGLRLIWRLVFHPMHALNWIELVLINGHK